MKIEIEVSDKNEGTDAPYWLILDLVQNMKLDIRVLAAQITGPYFSREDAENHMKNRKYNYSKRAVVYCLSGYYSDQYKMAIRGQNENK